jgi:hypothetical protein
MKLIEYQIARAYARGYARPYGQQPLVYLEVSETD